MLSRTATTVKIAKTVYEGSTPVFRHPQGKKKHININKFAGLSRVWVGGKILFICFLNPPKI